MAVPLPRITNAEEASQASAAILAAVSSGQLTPGEGTEIGRLNDGYVRAIEVSDFEKRLARLEGRAVTIIPPAAP